MSGPGNIKEWLQGLPIPWLVGGPNGHADVGSYGTVLDSKVALTKLAFKAGMPEKTPADGLDNIGHDRGLIQGGSIAGPAESNTAFGTRLRGAWDVRPYDGAPLAILLQLYYTLGYTSVAYAQQNGVVYTLTTPPTDPPLTDYLVATDAGALTSPAAPSADRPEQKIIPTGTPWWRFDDKTDFCSRFAIIFGTPLPASWVSIVNPPTTSSTPSLSEVNTIRDIIRRFKNAETTCMGIYVQLTGKLWGYPPTQVWGAATGNWGGTSTVFAP